jgi:CDP-diacylglycerol--glycerol-3-phosphate 3-phosphatidyltransferase
MDPVADKILVDASLILLINVPVWISYPQMTVAPLIVTILITRDLLVDAVRLVASNKKIVLAANKWGKMKTVFQMLAISMLFLNDWPFSLIGLPTYLSVTSCLLYLATFFSILSGIIYIYQNRKVFWFDK